MNEAKVERERRLPQWAQRELQRLRNDLAYEREKLAAGPEDSTVFVDPYSEVPRPLGKHPNVQFNLPADEPVAGRRYALRHVQVRYVDDDHTALRIDARNSLVIRPTASNSAVVTDLDLREWF